MGCPHDVDILHANKETNIHTCIHTYIHANRVQN